VAASQDALDELRQAVRRCREAGLLPAGVDPEDVVTQLRAVVHGLADFENLGRLEPEPERQWRAALSALFDGYTRGAAQAPAALR
jgi:hypothetical protein